MPLTDTAIKKAKPGAKPSKLSDGKGLYLLVSPAGSKLWRWKYRVLGKEKVLALGAYPAVSLAQAREGQDTARKMLASGNDPMVVRKADKLASQAAAENSFESVARKWWSHWKPARSEQHASQVMRRFEADVFPHIGARPVTEIQASELVAMLKAISGRGANDLAQRALQTSGQVFRYAIAHGLAKRNPAADIKPSDVLPSRQKQNMARIDGKELPELMRRIDAYQGTPITRMAMKLMAMTFVRTTELIGARWDEFDLGDMRWDIPASRMKMKTPHIVPMSTQAVSVLKTLHLVTGHSPLLFPGERDHEKSMSNNTILKALQRMGYKGRMTGHGFRGVASTLLHEMGFDHAHIELQLAHQERNEVSAAYNHATYLKQRAKMMQHWSDYLDACKEEKVLPFKRTAA
ncbi:MAG: tyrosine-type recombinase/integrase [Rhodoferax sp.]|jgi:integrase|nr:tyrosine-type recombinase/integrase [Rhodoferax sp.]HQX59468.1 tyrosine-type recombinase/integrase [Burkholderiaceae bacterium]